MMDTRSAARGSMIDRVPYLHMKCLSALRDAAMTADEIATAIGETVLATRPRITELRDLGRVQKTALRRPNASGRSATVWMLADA